MAIAKLEDRTLIEMALAGHTDCFSVLVQRHFNSVNGCIRSMMKDRPEVEDLVQNTFIKAWLNLPAFRFEANFRTWITSVAKNEALAFFRRQRSLLNQLADADLDALACSRESPHDILVRSEARRTVRKAIAGLPPKYRQVLTLCELEQLSAPEMALRLESSIALVKARRFRARKMLFAVLKGPKPGRDVKVKNTHRSA